MAAVVPQAWHICCRLSALENGHASTVGAGTSDWSDGDHALTNGHHALTNGHAHDEGPHVKLEAAPRPKKQDHTVFGLALYALSSCFLATMLVFAKRLGMLPRAPGYAASYLDCLLRCHVLQKPMVNGKHQRVLHAAVCPDIFPDCMHRACAHAGQWGIPVFEVLLARSASLVFFALIGCAVQGVNPLGKR